LLSEEVSNTKAFRADYTTLKTERHTRGCGVFICVKNYITCAELWVDEVYEMISVEIKGMDPNSTWEILGIYRVPNDDMQLLEKLTDRTGYTGRTTKFSFFRGVLKLPYADCNGNAEKSTGTRYF
jgi:hypothetical protein